MGTISKNKPFKFLKLRSQRRFAMLVACLFGLAALFNNCNNERLVPLSSNLTGVYSYATADAHFCTSAPIIAQQNMKYLFIIDHSASNGPLFLLPGGVSNADSTGSRRYGPMINFVQNMVNVANTTTAFDIIDFPIYDPNLNSGAGGLAPAGVIPSLKGFTPNAAFITAATADWIGQGTAANPQPVDGGFTDYVAALNQAITLITADATATQVQPGAVKGTNWYQIIFVTSGSPVVADPASNPPYYTQTMATDISPVINTLLNLKQNAVFGSYIANISLNTAYYYNATTAPDANAVILLQSMANAGNGVFEQFGGGAQVLYQQFSPPVRNIQNQLVDVFVENANAVWWDNGQIMQDSDGDGLPDAIEMQFGSNPKLADSDGNGVSDLVEYRTTGKPCQAAGCAQTGRYPYAICAGFNPTVNGANQVTFSSTSNDGLNDCEKFVLGGTPTTYSSSGSLVPDFMAFKNTISILPNQPNVALKDPFSDGVSNYSKMKSGLPVQVSQKNLLNYQVRSSDLELESQPSPTVNCYHMVVNNIAMTAPDNSIKVYVVQNNLAVQDKPFLKTATQPVSGYATATFQIGDFK